jgi:hypothetical protein
MVQSISAQIGMCLLTYELKFILKGAMIPLYGNNHDTYLGRGALLFVLGFRVNIIFVILCNSITCIFVDGETFFINSHFFSCCWHQVNIQLFSHS